MTLPDTQYFAKISKEERKQLKTAFQNLIEGRTNKIKEEYQVVNKQKGLHRIKWVEAQGTVETRDSHGKPLTLAKIIANNYQTGKDRIRTDYR